MKREHTECYESSAYIIQMPGNYPEESIQHNIFVNRYLFLMTLLHVSYVCPSSCMPKLQINKMEIIQYLYILEPLGLQHVDDIILYIDLTKVHFVGLYYMIILQCTVHKHKKSYDMLDCNLTYLTMMCKHRNI